MPTPWVLLAPPYLSDSLLTSPSANEVTFAGMPYATQWNTPRPPRPSGSTMVSARLLVPSGTPVHVSCGDTLSPTQFGFAAFLLATFFGIKVPSLKVVDDSANGSAALPRPQEPATNTLAASRVFTRCLESMGLLPKVLLGRSGAPPRFVCCGEKQNIPISSQSRASLVLRGSHAL